MAHGDAAARTERQVVALAIVLQHVNRNLEALDAWPGRRQARGQPRDLASHRQVAFEVSRRNRQRVGQVVEAAIGGLVAGEQRAHVEVEAEEVAHRVAVLRAVQAGDRRHAARPWHGRPGVVDLALEPAARPVDRRPHQVAASPAAASTPPSACR